MHEFLTTGRATQTLYDDQVGAYDFSHHRPVNLDARSVTAFTNIVWSSTKFVAFAVKDEWAVMAYCKPPVNEWTCYSCTKNGSNYCGDYK